MINSGQVNEVEPIRIETWEDLSRLTHGQVIEINRKPKLIWDNSQRSQVFITIEKGTGEEVYCYWNRGELIGPVTETLWGYHEPRGVSIIHPNGSISATFLLSNPRPHDGERKVIALKETGLWYKWRE